MLPFTLSLILSVFLFSSPISARIGFYTLPSTIDNTSLTFSDPNSNPASCSCNLKATSCDTFCCCDTLCSSDNINKWTSAKVCSSTKTSSSSKTSTINNCQQASLYGINSYQSLNCVYFDNSNTIGQYFQSAATDSLPSSDKIGEKFLVSSTIKPRNTSSIYIPGLPVYYGASASSVIFPQSFGYNCKQQQLIFGKNVSFSCVQTVSNQNCQTSIFKTLSNVCSTGKSNCNITPDISSLACTTSGNVNSFVMNIYVTGSQTYSIIKVEISGTQKPITAGTYTLKGEINFVFNDPVNVKKRSGAPGYVAGLPLSFYGSDFMPVSVNFNIRATGGTVCADNGTTKSGSVDFLTSKTASCRFISICPSTSPEIYNLFQYQNNSPAYISRYGNSLPNSNSNSNDMVTITYAPRTNNVTSCQFNVAKVTTLNIMYSIAGSSLDYQYYLLGAHVTYTEYSNRSETTQVPAFFNVKWVYVDPASVTAAPTNNFYIYFSRLWNPIQNTYNRLLFEKMLVGGVMVGLVALIL